MIFNNAKYFPKVLIIGQTFNRRTGGGITITNLFTGWPKERIAVATNDSIYNDIDTSVCEVYYQLTYGNKLHPFPLNIFLPRVKSGVFSEWRKNVSAGANSIPRSGSYKKIYKYLRKILVVSGLYYLLYKLKVTPEFRIWIKKYDPDIIYTQLASLELIEFVSKVKEVTGKPVIIHIMDDWPLTFIEPGIFNFYWKKVAKQKLNQLFVSALRLMSICEAMSVEYRSRYQLDFLPFHNPIDIEFWLPKVKKDYCTEKQFTVLYAGRIGNGIKDSISDIANAVRILVSEGVDIIFEIQTSDIEELDDLIVIDNIVRSCPATNYSVLPQRFSAADVLVLPQDFDDESVRFLKYSFPTKVSEYMISGTPILVYGTSESAIVKYALKEKWGYVVTDRNIQSLVDALRNLYFDTKLRKNLGELAQSIAIENEDCHKVREEFKMVLALGK